MKSKAKKQLIKIIKKAVLEALKNYVLAMAVKKLAKRQAKKIKKQ